MGIQGGINPVDIAVSGLRAQSTRMNVIAGNIANSSTSRTPSGGPYRRQEVILSSRGEGLAGVEVEDITKQLEYRSLRTKILLTTITRHMTKNKS